MDHRREDVHARPARRRRAWLPGPVLVLLAVVLAACGGSSGEGAEVASATDGDKVTSTTKKTDPRQAHLDFARCMREHGVDMPDPTFDDDGNVQLEVREGGGEVEQAGEVDGTFRDAEKACRHHLAGVMGDGPDGKPDAEMQDKALRFARCMRENGVTNFPDPDFSENGMVRIGGDGIDPSSPTTREAHKRCQSILGPPPSGGSAGAGAAPIGGEA
jgi:hypothetical protein